MLKQPADPIRPQTPLGHGPALRYSRATAAQAARRKVTVVLGFGILVLDELLLKLQVVHDPLLFPIMRTPVLRDQKSGIVVMYDSPRHFAHLRLEPSKLRESKRLRIKLPDVVTGLAKITQKV